MNSGNNFSLTAIIRAVRPKNAAQWIEGGLRCSPRQSWRIVQEGQPPGRLRAALIRMLKAEIANTRRLLERVENEIALQQDLASGAAEEAEVRCMDTREARPNRG